MAGKQANEFDRRLGERLRALRESRGMTQREVAGVIEISAAQLQKHEKGINRMSAGSVQAIAQYMKVSPMAFYDPEAQSFGGTIDPEAIRTALAHSREVVSLLTGEPVLAQAAE